MLILRSTKRKVRVLLYGEFKLKDLLSVNTQATSKVNHKIKVDKTWPEGQSN